MRFNFHTCLKTDKALEMSILSIATDGNDIKFFEREKKHSGTFLFNSNAKTQC